MLTYVKTLYGSRGLYMDTKGATTILDDIYLLMERASAIQIYTSTIITRTNCHIVLPPVSICANGHQAQWQTKEKKQITEHRLSFIE
jgi:hypothetical protein